MDVWRLRVRVLFLAQLALGPLAFGHWIIRKGGKNLRILPDLTFLKSMNQDKFLPIIEVAYRLALQLNKAMIKFP